MASNQGLHCLHSIQEFLYICLSVPIFRVITVLSNSFLKERISIKCQGLFSGKQHLFFSCSLLKSSVRLVVCLFWSLTEQVIKKKKRYCIYPKYWDTLSPYHTCPKV